MIYDPFPYPLINVAKLLDNDMFEMGFAQLKGFAVSVVSGELWYEYYVSTGEIRE